MALNGKRDPSKYLVYIGRFVLITPCEGKINGSEVAVWQDFCLGPHADFLKIACPLFFSRHVVGTTAWVRNREYDHLLSDEVEGVAEADWHRNEKDEAENSRGHELSCLGICSCIDR